MAAPGALALRLRRAEGRQLMADWDRMASSRLMAVDGMAVAGTSRWADRMAAAARMVAVADSMAAVIAAEIAAAVMHALIGDPRSTRTVVQIVGG